MTRFDPEPLALPRIVPEAKDDASLGSLSPRRRTTDEVYEVLRNAILSQQLLPGARLSVPSLSEQLGVSRSPVREAVQRLAQQGLATEEAHRGSVVARLDPGSILRLYEFREGLEALAARLACKRATDDQLADLEAILDEHTEALAHEDFRRHVELDQRFHAKIREATENEHLQGALERVQDMVSIAMLSADVSWPHHALAEHKAILDALASRSPDHAEAAAAQHISRLRKDLAVLFKTPRERPAIAERLESERNAP